MSFIQKIKNDKILNAVLQKMDGEIYLVGGAVRDFILEKETYDRDLLIVDREARDFALELAEKLDATFVPLDEVNKIYRIVFKDKINYIDVTNPLENSIEVDLKRRDLTINAIAVNMRTYDVNDCCGGLSDIQNKMINMISEKNFLDDPLRLLRVFRFQACLGFGVSNSMLQVVNKHKNLIHKPAYERITYELIKLFGGEYAHEALLTMDDCGLLVEVFPFVEELKQVPPNSHHHLDLFHHSVETVRQIAEIYKSSSDFVKEHLERVDFGGQTRLAHLKLAGFMHDIGKFSTWTIEEDSGRHRFIKHDDVGSKLAHKILKDMHFSNKQIDYVTSMIKNHIYPSHVMCSPEITDKIMMRFVRKMDSNSIDNIILAMADRLSARGPEITEDIVEKNISSLTRLMDFYLEKRDALAPLPKLLDGNEIMNILNIKPSAQLGHVMNALHEAQISGDVNSRDDAIKFIRNFGQK